MILLVIPLILVIVLAVGTPLYQAHKTLFWIYFIINVLAIWFYAVHRSDEPEKAGLGRTYRLFISISTSILTYSTWLLIIVLFYIYLKG